MKTGFEESRELNPPLGSLVAGRYEVNEWLGQAAFSTALQCTDTSVPEDDAGEHPAPESFSSGAQWKTAVCLRLRTAPRRPPGTVGWLEARPRTPVRHLRRVKACGGLSSPPQGGPNRRVSTF